MHGTVRRSMRAPVGCQPPPLAAAAAKRAVEIGRAGRRRHRACRTRCDRLRTQAAISRRGVRHPQVRGRRARRHNCGRTHAIVAPRTRVRLLARRLTLRDNAHRVTHQREPRRTAPRARAGLLRARRLRRVNAHRVTHERKPRLTAPRARAGLLRTRRLRRVNAHRVTHERELRRHDDARRGERGGWAAHNRHRVGAMRKRRVATTTVAAPTSNASNNARGGHARDRRQRRALLPHARAGILRRKRMRPCADRTRPHLACRRELVRLTSAAPQCSSRRTRALPLGQQLVLAACAVGLGRSLPAVSRVGAAAAERELRARARCDAFCPIIAVKGCVVGQGMVRARRARLARRGGRRRRRRGAVQRYGRRVVRRARMARRYRTISGRVRREDIMLECAERARALRATYGVARALHEAARGVCVGLGVVRRRSRALVRRMAAADREHELCLRPGVAPSIRVVVRRAEKGDELRERALVHFSVAASMPRGCRPSPFHRYSTQMN